MKKAKAMKVLHYKWAPDGGLTLKVREVGVNDLAAMQAMVGGSIQGLGLPHLGMTAWCNEDGMPLGLPAHVTNLAPVPIYGDFYVCRGSPNGDWSTLSEDDIDDLNVITAFGYEDHDEYGDLVAAGLSRGQP